MRKTILMFPLSCIALFATAQDVTLISLSGPDFVQALSTLGRVEIANSTYRVIDTDGEEVFSDNIANLKQISFVKTATPIVTAVKLENGDLLADAPTTIYDLSGRKVAQFDSGKYSTSGLTQGVYIVVSGCSVSKIIVK